MATANSTATTSRPRSTPKRAEKSPSTPGVIEHMGTRERGLIERALRVLERAAVYRAAPLSSPSAVRAHLMLRLAHLEHEEFIILWLDAQNRLISSDTHYVGTLTQASVYPREVVKAGLAFNAGAAILAHNHPSGVAEPSQADEMLTQKLKAALAMVDIKVLDHFIVAGTDKPLSFAERGLL
jgi:DNA repair protein RadC